MNGIEAQNLLRLLEDTARGIGVQIRYENLFGDDEIGGSRGGLCKLRGQNMILVERRLSPIDQCTIIAEALSTFDLSSIFVSPLVRQIVEKNSRF